MTDFPDFLHRLLIQRPEGRAAGDAVMASHMSRMAAANPSGFRQPSRRAEPGEGKRFAQRAAIRRETCAVIRAEQATRRRERGAGLVLQRRDQRKAEAALKAARERLNMARAGRCPDTGEALR
jgi:hypothetical protein